MESMPLTIFTFLYYIYATNVDLRPFGRIFHSAGVGVSYYHSSHLKLRFQNLQPTEKRQNFSL